MSDFEKMIAKNKDLKPFWYYVQSKNKTRANVGPIMDPTTGVLSQNTEECAKILSDFNSTVFNRETQHNIPFTSPKTLDELVHFQISL